FSQTRRDLHDKLLKHLSEERGHDLMLLNDLKHLGFEVTAIPELPATTSLYQSQYYYFDRENPAAHFGYAFYLEGLSARFGGEIAQNMRGKYGPNTATF